MKTIRNISIIIVLIILIVLVGIKINKKEYIKIDTPKKENMGKKPIDYFD